MLAAGPATTADVERTVIALEHSAREGPYQRLASTLGTLEGESSGHRAPAHELYRRLLAALLQRLDPSDPSRRIPPSLLGCYSGHVARMRRQVDEGEELYFRSDNDRFIKDLAICLYRLHPVGAELVDVRGRIPRSIFVRGGLGQALRAAYFFSVLSPGFAPYCELHMHPDAIEDFNEQGWIRTYLRVADLLEHRPALRGLFGTAWFYDPAIQTVSPHLGYLYRFRVAHGAVGFDYGPSETALSGALLRSASRRALYEQGSYLPRSYYLVWPRRRLLQWARESGGGSPTH
jgi:hypothetical protein